MTCRQQCCMQVHVNLTSEFFFIIYHPLFFNSLTKICNKQHFTNVILTNVPKKPKNLYPGHQCMIIFQQCFFIRTVTQPFVQRWSLIYITVQLPFPCSHTSVNQQNYGLKHLVSEQSFTCLYAVFFVLFYLSNGLVMLIDSCGSRW